MRYFASKTACRWPTPPFKDYLGAFSGPAIRGKDPPFTLVEEASNWTRRLAQQARLGEDPRGVSVRRAEFLSVHGGGGGGGGRDVVDPLTGKELTPEITLCYVLPTTTRGIKIQTIIIPIVDNLYNLQHIYSTCTAHIQLIFYLFSEDSAVVSRYPTTPDYPQFYDLSTILQGMRGSKVRVHPFTREMMSALDR